MQSCLTGGRGSAGASHRGQCPQCSVTGLVQGGLAGCRLAKAKPVDTVVADGRAVGRRVHLLGGLEGAGTVALPGMRRRKSGCVGKIEARPSPNCLDMASPSVANWQPTAHVSGSRASFGNSVPQEARITPVCRLCTQSRVEVENIADERDCRLCGCRKPQQGSSRIPRVAPDASPSCSVAICCSSRSGLRACRRGGHLLVLYHILCSRRKSIAGTRGYRVLVSCAVM